MDGAYNVKEAVVHAIEIRLNSLKERSGSCSCILESTTFVQTSQVKLEILENLDRYLTYNIHVSQFRILTSHSIQLVSEGACQNSRDSTGMYWYPPSGASTFLPLARVDLDLAVGG